MTRSTNDDDFEVVNGKKILKDGHRLVVKTAFMDSIDHKRFFDSSTNIAREVAAADIPRRRIVASDGLGGHHLKRPGPRYEIATAADAGEMAFTARDKKLMYDAYDQQVSSAWRGVPRSRDASLGEGLGSGQIGSDPFTAGGSFQVPQQQEGDLCTLNGFAGHLRMVQGSLQCVPDYRADAADAKRYQGYDPAGDETGRWDETGNGDDDDDDDNDETPRRRRRNNEDPEANVGDSIRRHQATMDRLYNTLDRDLEQAWRGNK